MKAKKFFSVLLILVMLVMTFTPIAYAENTNGLEGFVSKLYKLTLLREPDSGGLNYWIKELNSGSKTGADVSLNFIFSSEFINKKVDNTNFLDIMYLSFFDREPESNGREFWLGKMEQAYNRKYILANFVNSNEFKNICTTYGITPGIVKLAASDKISTPKLPNSRLNPATIGEKIRLEVDDWYYGKSIIELSLLETISGDEAWQIVENANMFNSPPESGTEYLLAKFWIKVISTEQEPYEINNVMFDVISGGGVLYNGGFYSISGLEPDLSTDLYVGAEHIGWTYFMVKTNDQNPVAVYNNDKIWFKLR